MCAQSTFEPPTPTVSLGPTPGTGNSFPASVRTLSHAAAVRPRRLARSDDDGTSAPPPPPMASSSSAFSLFEAKEDVRSIKCGSIQVARMLSGRPALQSLEKTCQSGKHT